jgi:uncharacterized damage-inducible protein DinB
VLLERLVAHLRWADSRTLDSLRAASAPPPKALELYAHILGAEHIWLARLLQKPPTAAVWPILDLDGCGELAAANHAELTRVVQSLDAAGLDREVPYVNSAGLSFRSSTRDILLHVALHGCYHRGQVAIELRRSSAEPQPTDYIAFVRGTPAATRVS